MLKRNKSGQFAEYVAKNKFRKWSIFKDLDMFENILALIFIAVFGFLLCIETPSLKDLSFLFLYVTIWIFHLKLHQDRKIAKLQSELADLKARNYLGPDAATGAKICPKCDRL